MTRQAEQYPNLDQLLGAYFHQDWVDEHLDERGVVSEFIKTNWRDDVTRTVADVERFALAHREDTMSALNEIFTPGIVVGRDDQEAMTWLLAVAEMLKQGVGEALLRPVEPQKPAAHSVDGTMK